MGYYVSVSEINFCIPDTPEVLQVLKDLNKRDDLKTGGRWSGGKEEEKWFAWMPADYDKTVTSVAEVFELLGFEVEVVDDGNKKIVRLVDYDKKMGNEVHFLEAVAPFVEEGSYIIWQGEEGAIWRNIVKNRQLLTQDAHITFR